LSENPPLNKKNGIRWELLSCSSRYSCSK